MSADQEGANDGPADHVGSADARRVLKAPSPLLMAFESRAAVETAAGFLALPLLRGAPRGDGHPVIVLPPFGAADQFTAGLRRFLANRGYDVHPWGHPEVLGLHRLVHVAAERVRDVSERNGQAVTLIGHSLGGVYAREVARFTPDDVRFVVTMGSPINDLKANHVWPMFESGERHQGLVPPRRLRGEDGRGTTGADHVDLLEERRRRRLAVMPRPHRRSGRERRGRRQPHRLPSNPMAIRVVADRLAQPIDSWEPFHRPGMRRLGFPAPSRTKGKGR